MLVVGDLSVVLGFLSVIGLIFIILYLLHVSFVIHDFWAVEEEQKMNEQNTFTKNIALAGAALALMYGAPVDHRRYSPIENTYFSPRNSQSIPCQK